MDTTDRILVIILTTLLSIFIIICTIAAVGLTKLIREARIVIAKTEEVVDTVESAAESLKRTSNSLNIFKAIGNVIDLAQKGKGRRR